MSKHKDDCAGRNVARDHGKHTPGPWVADADDDNDIGEFTIRTVDGDYIADIRNPYCDYHTQVVYALSDDCRLEADARLIAAAPELLEALRAIDDFWTERIPDGPDHTKDAIGRPRKMSDPTVAVWRTIRSAIAKAEGRSDV